MQTPGPPATRDSALDPLLNYLDLPLQALVKTFCYKLYSIIISVQGGLNGNIFCPVYSVGLPPENYLPSPLNHSCPA